MSDRKVKVALVVPNGNSYSETFIQAHRNIPDVEIHYLFGGLIPKFSEREGSLAIYPAIFERVKAKLAGRRPDNIYEKGFKSYLLKHKIDAVLAEFGMTGAEIMPTCKKLNIPLFVHFHGLDASVKNILDTYRDKYLSMFEYASKVFAVSKKMNQTLIDLGCPAQKLILNTYGPNDLFLNASSTFSESKSFVAIGRFVDKKAPYYTILAVKKVAEIYPEIKLYFAGTGELYETCGNLVRYFNLERNVKLLGVITPETYVSILSRVTGFVQHSITAVSGDMEGTPLGVLEASAAGIPVIATRHAGIPDVIIDGKTGLLVDEHDVDGMAKRMMHMIENPDLAKQLGAAGKERVKQNFSMDQHLKVISKVLRNSLLEPRN